MSRHIKCHRIFNKVPGTRIYSRFFGIIRDCSLTPFYVTLHVGLQQAEPLELSDSPFILMTPGTSIRKISDYIFAQAGFTPTVVYESGNNTVVQNMVRGGSGIGFQPRSLARLNDPDIAYLSLSPRVFLDLCIILKKGTVLTESERYFIYLMMLNDMGDPYYTLDFNEAARAIWNEFHTE